MIRNVYLGDLLPLDLQNYILQSLRIGEGERLDSLLTMPSATTRRK